MFAGPIAFSHPLDLDRTASDEALIALLDGYPEELMDINSYSYDHNDQFTLTTGVRGRAQGAAILREIKEGRLWVNLRGVSDRLPDLWAEAMTTLDAAARGWGLRPVKAAGQLILSSPRTRVPYHFDAANVVLFHLRGRKRIYVYSPDEAHLPQAHVERSIMRQTTEELPYHSAMDQAAWVRELSPGEAVTWPLYAPHRVENLGEFNLSLSIEFQTWDSRVTGGAHFFNGVLRRWGLAPAPMQHLPVAARTGLWLCSLIVKRLGLVKDRIKDIERSFDLGVLTPGET